MLIGEACFSGLASQDTPACKMCLLVDAGEMIFGEVRLAPWLDFGWKLEVN